MARRRRPKRKCVSPRPAVQTCPLCGEAAHLGDSEEPLAALDPEAAVYYDRDVADAQSLVGLCGPRFRRNSAGLYAHYGSPHGSRYVVYEWQSGLKSWKNIIDSVADDQIGSRRRSQLS